jgi:hypothetical protein
MNEDNRYEIFRDKTEKDEKTLLHYAAEQNFYHVARTLIRFCPGLLALKTKPILAPERKPALLPVEIALNENKDEVAAVMLRHMSHERYICIRCTNNTIRSIGGLVCYCAASLHSDTKGWGKGQGLERDWRGELGDLPPLSPVPTHSYPILSVFLPKPQGVQAQYFCWLFTVNV